MKSSPPSRSTWSRNPSSCGVLSPASKLSRTPPSPRCRSLMTNMSLALAGCPMRRNLLARFQLRLDLDIHLLQEALGVPDLPLFDDSFLLHPADDDSLDLE